MDQEYLQVIRLNCGSKQAFTAIYNKYVGRIFNYVCAMTRDEVLAEDITQFCFMKLWERRKEIRPDENFAAYLYVIARNAVYKETRRLITSANYIDFLTHASAIGLNSNVVKLVKSGGKPLLLGACCWAGITAVSLLMQRVMGLW